ncbi:MAG: acyltransferase [Clostridia bacterium]|nr:acyltransferase [Clostridia bacterium]
MIINNELLQEQNTNINNTKRQSNFELLRIICMLLIITHHLSVHSYYTSDISIFNQYLIRFFQIGGKLGVNVYVLISGYFMITSNFKLKKLVKLIIETIFYSISIYLIFCIFGIIKFDYYAFLQSLFVIRFNKYWFITSFIILYAISPFLNKCLRACNYKEMLVLIAILLFVQLEIPKVPTPIISNEFLWFVTLYVVASFIRLHGNDLLNSFKFTLPVFIVSFVLIALNRILYLNPYDSLVHLACFICSVSLFLIFKNINIGYIKIINFISSSTLAVYLIHDNKLVREQIWNVWLKMPNYAYSNRFILYAIIVVFAVFIICILIDFIRRLIINLSIKIFKRLKIKN